MEGRRVLRSLSLLNVLSFGPVETTLELQPLNVLIGPNGSGKTNLVEVVCLLRSLAGDLSRFMSEAGGISEWLWKGKGGEAEIFIESRWIDVYGQTLKHALTLRPESFRPRVVAEKIGPRLLGEYVGQEDVEGDEVLYWYSSYPDDSLVNVPERLKTDRSILAQRREKADAGIDDLVDFLSTIRCYRDWTFGPHSPGRRPQKADLPGDFLAEDTSNLGLVLNTLALDRRSRGTLIDNLGKLFAGVSDIRVNVVAGFVELMVEEEHDRLIPAVRLSDGTLRYLSLLAILCHPDPPPLICIEEPELGLHPDLMPAIANLLRDASLRTQLIVTTHSAELVSALGDVPEAVVVCERGENGTEFKRLDPAQMEVWLKKYSLGELWLSGEIGGTRW